MERTAPGESAAAWLSALSTFNPADASPLKEERDDATLLARLNGRDVVLKRWSLPTLWDRLKHIARASRAWRQWRGAERLAAANIPAARGLTIATEYGRISDGLPTDPTRWHRRPPRAWLIMDVAPGHSVLEHLASVAGHTLSPREQHAVARALAAMLGQLHAAHLYNRDGKPSNLLVSGFDAAGLARITVIDTVGIRTGFPARGTIITLKNLCMEPLGHGCPPRKALMARVIASLDDAAPRSSASRAWRRDLWRDVAAAVKAHGDPTPRVDILSVARQSGQARINPLAPSANAK